MKKEFKLLVNLVEVNVNVFSSLFPVFPNVPAVPGMPCQGEDRKLFGFCYFFLKAPCVHVFTAGWFMRCVRSQFIHFIRDSSRLSTGTKNREKCLKNEIICPVEFYLIKNNNVSS